MHNPAALIRITKCMPVDAMPFIEPAESDARRIVRGLRRKDMAIVNQLVGLYHYRLVRYLLYFTGRRERVEDLVQDTWLRVLRRGSQFDGRSRFEPWLFSIARNLAIDDLRKRKIVSLDTPQADTPQAGTPEAAGPQEGLAGELPAPDQSSPFLAAARSEDAARLAAALGLLEPIYREALLLRFQEDLSLQEISKVVGAPVPTVSSRIHRGLGLLRSRWQGGSNAV
jgi:RNA polymerase sigma-70 factor (ECF subfamily)